MVAVSRLPLGMPSFSFISSLRRRRRGCRLALQLIAHVAVFESAIEAAFVTRVTDAGTERLSQDQQGVAIAIGGNGFQEQEVAGTFAFGPELLAGTAEEGDVAGGDCFIESLAVHIANPAFGAQIVPKSSQRQ